MMFACRPNYNLGGMFCHPGYLHFFLQPASVVAVSFLLKHDAQTVKPG